MDDVTQANPKEDEGQEPEEKAEIQEQADAEAEAEEAEAVKETEAQEEKDAEAEAQKKEAKKALRSAKAKIKAQEKEIEALNERTQQLEAVLQKRNEADMANLSDEDKALVESLSGDDALRRNEVIGELLKANKIGKASRPAVDESRTAGGEKPSDAPKSWDEADQRFAASLSRRRAN